MPVIHWRCMVSKFFMHPYVSLVFRLILGGVFIYAGSVKVSDPFGFSIQIRNYHIVPETYTNIIAIILPWLELISGLMLIAGYYIHVSSRLLIVILSIFILAIFSAVMRGFDINCGCYSTDSNSATIGINRIIEDILLLLMSIQILLVKNHKFVLEFWIRKMYKQ